MANSRPLGLLGASRLANMGRRNPKTIGIIGAGRFGTGAAQELIRNGHHVLLIDQDAECLEPLAHQCHTAIGNAEDSEFLAEAGIKDVDAVIIAIGDNETASNHATINCKDFGLYVVAKATHATHGKILDRLGADYVVYPEHDSGVRLARLLTRSSILEMIELYEEVFMMEVNAGGELIGKSLENLNLPHRYGVQVLLILRANKTVFPVSAKDIVQDGDRVVLLGSSESLHRVAKAAESD
ncbi:potassium channel family protein [Alicyclobacillus mengziensis]|uniref:TrkA family potassium uptake protein n=1 Tax=Alicyclobacillus mengziensis TaxID=2931921 RepID=A0A9X7Z5F0_9BACL|nr:TrkA family potassium uptake protein [Alicyclobacillus mengziensis]QSO46262.1 TrkA family potassium uptake protein [Alicyclobacillus mengziensis]